MVCFDEPCVAKNCRIYKVKEAMILRVATGSKKVYLKLSTIWATIQFEDLHS